MGIVAFLASVGVGCVLAIPYAFFCKAIILGFLVGPYTILLGSIVGAVFAYGALRGKANRKIIWLILWGVIAGGVTMPVAQLLINAIGVCRELFLPPDLLLLFGGVGAIGYVACERGTRGKRNREREQRYRRAIAEHAKK